MDQGNQPGGQHVFPLLQIQVEYRWHRKHNFYKHQNNKSELFMQTLESTYTSDLSLSQVPVKYMIKIYRE